MVTRAAFACGTSKVKARCSGEGRDLREPSDLCPLLAESSLAKTTGQAAKGSQSLAGEGRGNDV